MWLANAELLIKFYQHIFCNPLCCVSSIIYFHLQRIQPQDDDCPWLLRSPDTQSYDLLDVSGDWSVWKGVIASDARVRHWWWRLRCWSMISDFRCKIIGIAYTIVVLYYPWYRCLCRVTAANLIQIAIWMVFVQMGSAFAGTRWEAFLTCSMSKSCQLIVCISASLYLTFIFYDTAFWVALRASNAVQVSYQWYVTASTNVWLLFSNIFLWLNLLSW